MIVAKLGGSVAEGEDLPRWLAALEPGKGRTVVVAGGGVFAETVRSEQRRHGFTDRAAHHMAILAMEQFAVLVADRVPSSTPCRTLEEMRAALAAGRLAVWLPSLLALADRAIEESWAVTSDSLSAWLARRLGAERLILVKSVTAPLPLDAGILAQRGLVDPAFPAFFSAADLDLDWVGPGEEGRLSRLLAA